MNSHNPRPPVIMNTKSAHNQRKECSQINPEPIKHLNNPSYMHNSRENTYCSSYLLTFIGYIQKNRTDKHVKIICFIGENTIQRTYNFGYLKKLSADVMGGGPNS